MRDDLRTLPKIELHCHLDGSLDPEFVRYTLEQQGESVPLPQLLELLQAPESCASLAEYLQRFQLPIRCMDTPQQVRRSAYTFLRSLKEDGVRYAEVRFSPALLENSSLTARQAVEEVLSGLDAARRESGVEYGVILCAMRHHTQEKNEEMFRLPGSIWDRVYVVWIWLGMKPPGPTGNFSLCLSRRIVWGCLIPFTPGNAGALKVWRTLWKWEPGASGTVSLWKRIRRCKSAALS